MKTTQCWILLLEAVQHSESVSNSTDSIDERMLRVPNDLNDVIVRKEYIENHVKWFLKNHPDRIESFMQDVREKYRAKSVVSYDLFEAIPTV